MIMKIKSSNCILYIDVPEANSLEEAKETAKRELNDYIDESIIEMMR